MTAASFAGWFCRFWQITTKVQFAWVRSLLSVGTVSCFSVSAPLEPGYRLIHMRCYPSYQQSGAPRAWRSEQ